MTAMAVRLCAAAQLCRWTVMNVVVIYFIPRPLAGCEHSLNTSPGLIFQASDRTEQWAPNSLNEMGLVITEAEIWYITEN